MGILSGKEQPRSRVTVITLNPEPWMVGTLCRTDPDPDKWDSANLPRHPDHQRYAAFKLCSPCGRFAECADFALRTEASGHVYAGIPLGLAGQNKDKYAELKQIADRTRL